MSVTREEFIRWIEAHGEEFKWIRSASFVPESFTDEARVPLRVERYALDEDGQPFIDPETREAAIEIIYVPLRSLIGVGAG